MVYSISVSGALLRIWFTATKLPLDSVASSERSSLVKKAVWLSISNWAPTVPVGLTMRATTSVAVPTV